MKGEGRVISTVVFSLVIFVAFTLAPIVQLSTARTTHATQDSSKASRSLEEANVEQPKILEHKVTASELEKLKKQVGVWEGSRNPTQIINGHGTGLRPPTESEWTQIEDSVHIVDKIYLDSSIQIPSSVDCSAEPWFPPIGDQGGQGSCTCWAVGYYMKTYQEAKEHQWDLSGALWENGQPTLSYQTRIISPSFIYNLINGGVDEGSFASTAIGLISSVGACSWKEMSYNDGDFNSWPSEEAWREAPTYRGNYSGPEWLQFGTDSGLASLKNWIASDNLAVISVDSNKISNGLWSFLTANDVLTLDNYQNVSTNHANTIVGYDDNIEYVEEGVVRHGAFKIANSWGIGGWLFSWENVRDGFYWISYEAMKQQVRNCIFCRDITGYEPQLLASFRINHTKRGECLVTIGIGNHANPIYTKSFNYYISGGDHPFCPNDIIFDITEFKDKVPTLYDKSFFISVSDIGSNTTGTLTAFLVHNVVSGNPPLATVENSPVFANVFLSHIIHVPSDYSTMQQAVNSVVLGNNEDPGVIINVARGTYLGNVVVNKTVSIFGEAPQTTFVNNSYTAFDVLANNVHIANFTIINGGYGILVASSNNSIAGNKIMNNSFGILLVSSSNDTLVENAMINNTFNFGILGFSSEHFEHSIDISNLVNNKPIYYFRNQKDMVIDPEVLPEVGYLGLVSCSNITVEGLDLRDNVNGILFADVQDSRITANNISRNYVGSYLYNCVSIDVTGNNILNNVNGSTLYFSNYSSIRTNNITDNQDGVHVDCASNNSILDNNVTGNQRGISLEWSAKGNTVSGNNITTADCGVWVWGASNNSLLGNTVVNNHIGLRLDWAFNNTISGNGIAQNLKGVVLEWSSNNTIFGNNVTRNLQTGIMIDSSSDNTITANNITANNDRGIDIDSVWQSSAYDNCITDNNITDNNGTGVSLGRYAMFTRILRNNIANNLNGTTLLYANYTTIYNNNITYNMYGITLEWYSSYNNITDNKVENNQVGIRSGWSSVNRIANNTILDNQIGLSLYASALTTITGNTIANNLNGTEVYSSDMNTITQNNISGNVYYGILLHLSSWNSIFHNNFANNWHHVMKTLVYATSWDDGYPSGGNYWSDYNGSDLFWGTYQNMSGSDGVGDTKYIIDANNTDRFPLMKPWAPPDIALLDLTTSKTIVGQGLSVQLNVTVENQGNKVEGFAVDICLNESLFHSENFTLTSGNSTFTITWNTSSFAYGNYTISAYAWPVPGETDTADNTFTDGMVYVGVPGDINGDGIVDIYDALKLGGAYNSQVYRDDPNWNANADINSDANVDIYDAIILAGNYGKTA